MISWLEKINLFKSITKIKAFFSQPGWKETIVFLFFILLALGFWLLQNLQQEYEIEIHIPVKYRNMPEEMVSIEDYPQEIVARVRDKGNVLINYSWLRFFSPVEVNLSDIRKEKNLHIPRRTIETSISKQLVSTTSLLDIEPQTITIEYTEVQNKEVPVVIDISVSLEPGYRISDAITAFPENVRLYADSHTLDSITIVKTVFSEIKKADQTKEVKIRLQQIAGVQMEPNEVTVIIPIEEFTEKRMTLEIKCTDIPEKYSLRMFPSSVEIVCNVPLSSFKELTESDFELHIPFQEFETNQSSGKILLYLTKKPVWVIPPIIIPDVIEFILEQNNL